MRIAIVTNILPYPLNSGGAQAQFNMINKLRKKHSITLIFTQDGRNKIRYMNSLKKLWTDVDVIPFFYVRQLCYPRFLIDKIKRAFKLKFMSNNDRFKIERTIKPYGVYFSHDFVSFVNDIIYQKNISVVQVEFYPCLHIVNYLPENVKKVFIHHEIRFIRNERFLADFTLTKKEIDQKKNQKILEIQDLNKYDCVVTLTDKDKNVLSEAGVLSNLVVSPAAVNATLLPYSNFSGKISFVGGYSHIPNQEGMDWFIKEVMPRLSSLENIEVDIVGLGWPESYERLYKFIHLYGFVDNLATVLSGSIMIVPILTGSGMRMKILESAAMSVPFITTSVGVEGLSFKDGESCIIADDPESFANGIKKLIKDEAFRKKFAINAQKVYINNFSVESLVQRRDQVYSDLFIM